MTSGKHVCKRWRCTQQAQCSAQLHAVLTRALVQHQGRRRLHGQDLLLCMALIATPHATRSGSAAPRAALQVVQTVLVLPLRHHLAQDGELLQEQVVAPAA